METLKTFLHDSQRFDIHILASYSSRHIESDWEEALDETYDKMVELYPKIGDSAYATYGKRLFQPIHDQLKLAGLQAIPQLPGDLMISREWGQSEQDRQRWMWSEIRATNNDPLGTIVILVFHDHEQIRIPRAFQVIALEETGTDEVITRLSALSSDFKVALDMKTEVEQYMANQSNDDN